MGDMTEEIREEIEGSESADSVNETGGSSIAVQAGILAVATIVVRIIGLLYRAPLTAIIGDEGNGYYGAAYNIYMIILILSSNSLPAAISRQMSTKIAVGEYRNAQRAFHCALLYSLIVGTAGSLLLYFGAGILVKHNAVPVLRVFAPTIFLFGILGAVRGYFQAHVGISDSGADRQCGCQYRSSISSDPDSLDLCGPHGTCGARRHGKRHGNRMRCRNSASVYDDRLFAA